jgi:hypothetical protein
LIDPSGSSGCWTSVFDGPQEICGGRANEKAYGVAVEVDEVLYLRLVGDASEFLLQLSDVR